MKIKDLPFLQLITLTELKFVEERFELTMLLNISLQNNSLNSIKVLSLKNTDQQVQMVWDGESIGDKQIIKRMKDR